MSVAVVVAVAVSVVAFVAVAVVVFVSVPRSLKLLLNTDVFQERTVTVELGRRMPNGKFDFDRGDRKKIRFARGARLAQVKFDGLVPGAWYRVDTAGGSGGVVTRTMLMPGSFVEINIDRASK